MEPHEEKKLLDRITNIMDLSENKWFFCFGTLQMYILRRRFKVENYDIDIGVIQDKCNIVGLRKIWEGFNYEETGAIYDDASDLPLNLHYTPQDEEGPTIDIYLWYRHKNMLYHTYDVKREGLKRPTEYYFKGVKAEYLDPPQDLVEDWHKKDQTMRLDGTWQYDAFDDHDGYSFRLPFAYGTLMDIWYEKWLFPENNFPSRAQHIVKLKTCRDWSKV